MAEFSFPRRTASDVEAQLQEAARQIALDNRATIEGSGIAAPLELEQPISLECTENLLAEARRKISPGGWPYFFRTLRRQSRMNNLILWMLEEMINALKRLNSPLQSMREQFISSYQQSVVIRYEMRRQVEKTTKQQTAIESLE